MLSAASGASRLGKGTLSDVDRLGKVTAIPGNLSGKGSKPGRWRLERLI